MGSIEDVDIYRAFEVGPTAMQQQALSGVDSPDATWAGRVLLDPSGSAVQAMPTFPMLGSSATIPAVLQTASPWAQQQLPQAAAASSRAESGQHVWYQAGSHSDNVDVLRSAPRETAKPSKAKRFKYRRLRTNLYWLMINDPWNFDFDSLKLPKFIAEDAYSKEKLKRKTLVILQEIRGRFLQTVDARSSVGTS